MEKHACLLGVGATGAELGPLPRSDRADTSRDLGGLDSAHGDYLFASVRAAVSAFQSGIDLLGLAVDLHDKSIFGKDRSRRAAGAGYRGTLKRLRVEAVTSGKRYGRFNASSL